MMSNSHELDLLRTVVLLLVPLPVLVVHPVVPGVVVVVEQDVGGPAQEQHFDYVITPWVCDRPEGRALTICGRRRVFPSGARVRESLSREGRWYLFRICRHQLFSFLPVWAIIIMQGFGSGFHWRGIFA